MKTEFKKGLKQGFSLPGFAMGSAMIGFGALAYESNLDYFVTIASMLFLWSMPGMILFVTLISSGASIILMFMSIFLANIRTLFIVLSAFLTMNVASQKNSFLNKLFWAQWVSPTAWTVISTNPDKVSKKYIFIYYKGLAVGLVVMCFIGLSIGYFIFSKLSKELITIPIFFIPLYLMILMLNAKDKIYIITIVFSGFLLIVSYPFLGDWSILTSGLLSAIPGYLTGRFLKI